MIDPFDGYFSVSDLPTLFDDMIEYINKGRGPIYYADNANVIEFQGDEIVTLMFGKKIEDILSDICFKNVDRFLEKYFIDSYLKNTSKGKNNPPDDLRSGWKIILNRSSITCCVAANINCTLTVQIWTRYTAIANLLS